MPELVCRKLLVAWAARRFRVPVVVAEDYVQEAFIRSLKVDGPGIPWFYRTCTTIWIDHVRYDRRRVRLVPLDNLNVEEHEHFCTLAGPDTADGPMLAEANDEELWRWVAGVVSPASFTLLKVWATGASYEEMQDMFGIPMGTVKSRLSRSFSALKTRKRELLEVTA